MDENEGCEDPKIVCPSAKELGIIINNITCEKCGLTFNNEPNFRMHDIKVHKRTALTKLRVEKNVRYHCPIETCIYSKKCGKYFTLWKYIKQHYLKVHAEKIYNCEQCSKGFSTEAAKKAHIKECGVNFKCSCKMTFRTYSALTSHAKRNFHSVDEQFKDFTGKNRQSKVSVSKMQSQVWRLQPPEIVPDNASPIYVIKTPAKLVPVYLLVNSSLKSMNTVSVQTEETRVPLPRNKRSASLKTRETQTNTIPKKRRSKKCAETQTVKSENKATKQAILKQRKEHSEESNSKFTSETLFPESPLPLHHDVGFQDFWEEKKITSTQTRSEDFFEAHLDPCKFVEISNQGEESFSNPDPLLTEDTYKLSSSIETQTDLEDCKLFDDSDVLSRYNNETQTTEDYDDFVTRHVYSNMFTQTCDEILPSNLTLSNIQTQTAWPHMDETLVSIETQTKFEKDLDVEYKSWLNIQTNHMETQTDLLSIVDEFHEFL